MKRFCAAILALSLLAAALSGCGAAQSAPETTAAQTTFPTETAAPETTVPEPQPTVTVDAVPVPQYSQYEAPQPGVAEPVITGSQTAVHVSTADEFLAAIASDGDHCRRRTHRFQHRHRLRDLRRRALPLGRGI